jgi:transcriptional regulator with XRE-family HTH domain
MADRPDNGAEPLASMIDPLELGDRIRAKRRSKGLSIRQAAAETGVSAPTLSRVERGAHLPERENLLKLARWAGIRIDPDVHTGTRARNRAVHDPGASTLEAVELHLRADKNLGRADADALTEMFRVAYEHLASKTKGTKR